MWPEHCRLTCRCAQDHQRFDCHEPDYPLCGQGYGMKKLDVLLEDDQDESSTLHAGRAVAVFRDVPCASRALAAMGGKRISGQPYRVAFEGAPVPEVSQTAGDPGTATNGIEIANLIPDISREDIQERFKRYGTIKNVTPPYTSSRNAPRGSTVRATCAVSHLHI